jgi:hypothetical protein
MPARIGPIAAGVFFAAFGVTFVVAGVMLCDQIAGMEAAGNVRGLSTRTEFLYTHLGKWGVFAAYELLGMSFLIAAIDKVRVGLRLA